MKVKKAFKRTAAVVIGAALLTSACGISTLATGSESNLINVQHTYSNNGYTFEKISHASQGTETPDGVVDYLGNHNIEAYKDGVSEIGKGDSTQSYSYCAATYGDWIYVGTMYGALSAYAQAKNSLVSQGVSEDIAIAVVDAMFNGKLNKGRESDGYYAGSVFFKFNVVTGETKILMSREMFENGECSGVPIFRSAVSYNDKLYFVGLVSKGEALTQYGNMALDMEIIMQTGIPSIYELDPTTDELVEVYRCVDMNEYNSLVKKNVFTSTRAIGTYKDYLIAGGITTDLNDPDDKGQAVLYATNNPGSGDFKIIADMKDLFNYPAIWRNGSSGGGGIYQVVEYNGSLYVAIVSGTYETMDEKTRQFRPFAIVRGDYDETKGSIDNADAWTWTSVIGDQENDNAKYTFGIDPERTSSGGCTMQVYNGYLYIGEYNDVNGGLNGVLQYREFATLANNLEQSINLYRLDKDENIELVVGDATEMFPDGSISGWNSGYETHMTQYTWMTTVYDDVMYLSTMDETSLLHTFAQLVNGELLEMSEEEWESQVNYIKVLVELIKSSMKESVPTTYTVNETIEKRTASNIVETVVENVEDVDNLTNEQEKEIVDAIVNGDIDITEDTVSIAVSKALDELNNALDELTELISTNDITSFSEAYEKLLQAYEKYKSELPPIVQAAYEILLNYATLDNMKDLLTCMSYMRGSVAGFDLYAIKQADDGSVSITTVTNNGFNDRYNHGLRIFGATDSYMVIGTANPFYGTQLWRMSETPDNNQEESSNPSDESSNEESSNPSDESSNEESSNPSDESSNEESSNPSDESSNEESSNPSDESSNEESSNPSDESNNQTSNNNNENSQNNADNGNKPQTGDHTNIFVWIMLGIASICSSAAVIIKKQKIKN